MTVCGCNIKLEQRPVDRTCCNVDSVTSTLLQHVRAPMHKHSPVYARLQCIKSNGVVAEVEAQVYTMESTDNNQYTEPYKRNFKAQGTAP